MGGLFAEFGAFINHIGTKNFRMVTIIALSSQKKGHLDYGSKLALVHLLKKNYITKTSKVGLSLLIFRNNFDFGLVFDWY